MNSQPVPLGPSLIHTTNYTFGAQGELQVGRVLLIPAAWIGLDQLGSALPIVCCPEKLSKAPWPGSPPLESPVCTLRNDISQRPLYSDLLELTSPGSQGQGNSPSLPISHACWDPSLTLRLRRVAVRPSPATAFLIGLLNLLLPIRCHLLVS